MHAGTMAKMAVKYMPAIDRLAKLANDVATYDLQGLLSHSQHVANFLAAIDGTGPIVCTGHDGLEAVRLVLASYESAETGMPVVLAG